MRLGEGFCRGLPGMLEALGSIPSTEGALRQRGEKGKAEV